jgi:DNA-binding protein H-NS
VKLSYQGNEMNLDGMTFPELKQLRSDIEMAMVEREKQDRANAKAAAEAAAAEYGFTLSELFDGKKPAKSKAAPKYRNPDNSDQTWSGRGRKPEWLVNALNAGTKLDDLEV